MNPEDFIGKIFKSIKEDDYGGIALEFEDGSIAHYSVITYPDGTVRTVYFDHAINEEVIKEDDIV